MNAFSELLEKYKDFDMDDFIIIDTRKRVIPVTEENISDAARFYADACNFV